MHLYELSHAYGQAFDAITDALADDPNLTQAEREQIINDSLITISDDFDNKAINVAHYIANLELELANIDTVVERLKAKQVTLKRKISNLRDYLQMQMEVTGKVTVKSDMLSVTIRSNPAKVVVAEGVTLPDEFLTVKTELQVSKTALANALKSGRLIEGVSLVTSKRLEIK